MKRPSRIHLLILMCLLLYFTGCKKVESEPFLEINEENVMKELYGGFVTVVLLENGTISSDIGDVYTLNFSFPLISVRKHHDWNDTINCQPRLGLYMYAEGKIMVEMEPATIDDSLCLCVAPFAFGEKSEWQIAYLMHNEVALYGKVQNNTYYLCLSN